MKKLIYILIAILMVSCARNFTKERYVWMPYNKTDNKQTKERITIERHDLNALPAEFYIANRKDRYSGSDLPTILLVPQNALIEKISITNNTKHVIRMGNTVFRGFDPAGNQYETLSKDELYSVVYSQLTPDLKAEQSYPIINSSIKSLKMIDRNTELLPDYTTTGYIIYAPDNIKMTGTWKLAIYEFPVETDDSGRAIKTINFTFRSISKKYIDQYESGELVKSVEVK
jgi:hypothetical protein